MLRQYHVGTGKEGMAPERMETMSLISKALNSWALARALLVAMAETPGKLANVRKRIS